MLLKCLNKEFKEFKLFTQFSLKFNGWFHKTLLYTKELEGKKTEYSD